MPSRRGGACLTQWLGGVCGASPLEKTFLNGKVENPHSLQILLGERNGNENRSTGKKPLVDGSKCEIVAGQRLESAG